MNTGGVTSKTRVISLLVILCDRPIQLTAPLQQALTPVHPTRPEQAAIRPCAHASLALCVTTRTRREQRSYTLARHLVVHLAPLASRRVCALGRARHARMRDGLPRRRALHGRPGKACALPAPRCCLLTQHVECRRDLSTARDLAQGPILLHADWYTAYISLLLSGVPESTRERSVTAADLPPPGAAVERRVAVVHFDARPLRGARHERCARPSVRRSPQ